MEQEKSTEQKKRKSLLLVILCICTFIFSGLMAILFLAGIFASGYITGLLSDYISDISVIASSFTLVMIIFFLLWLFSLVGAVRMMQMKRSGYVLYVIPNLLMLIPQIALIRFIPTIHWFFYLYTIISVLFIILYAFCLKRM